MFSQRVARRIRISEQAPRRAGRNDGINDGMLDHDGGHDTVSDGFDGDHDGYDMTWPATQVCRRTVEGCLGGHDDGASVDDDSAENASLLFRKQGRPASSALGTFSRFNTFQNKGSFLPENQSRHLISTMGCASTGNENITFR